METVAPLLDALVQLAVVFLAALAPILVAKAIKAFEVRSKIDLDVEQEKRLHDLVERGIHYAEEQAHKALKGDGDQSDGAQKMEAAIAFITEEGARLGLDRAVAMGAEGVAKIVEAKLSQKRLDSNDNVDATPKKKPKSGK